MIAQIILYKQPPNLPQRIIVLLKIKVLFKTTVMFYQITLFPSLPLPPKLTSLIHKTNLLKINNKHLKILQANTLSNLLTLPPNYNQLNSNLLLHKQELVILIRYFNFNSSSHKITKTIQTLYNKTNKPFLSTYHPASKDKILLHFSQYKILLNSQAIKLILKTLLVLYLHPKHSSVEQRYIQ